TFPDNKFILLDGVNGSGKSTIFKAICFVLYEKYKTVKHGQDSCHVTLTLDKTIISRNSKPKTLNITYNDEKFHGSGAQELLVSKIINMNWEQFQYSTMINSNIRCSLASITSGDRFKVIQDLVSSLDKPKEDLAKLVSFQTGIETGLNVTTGKLELLRKQLASLKSEISEQDETEQIEFDAAAFSQLKQNIVKMRNKRERWLEITSCGLTQDEAEQRLEQLNSVDQIKSKIASMKKCLQYLVHMQHMAKSRQDFEKIKEEYFVNISTEYAQVAKKVKKENIETLKDWAKEMNIRQSAQDEGNSYYNASCEKIKKDYKIIHYEEKECPHCNESVGVAVGHDLVIWSDDLITDCKFDLSRLATLTTEWDETVADRWNDATKQKMRLIELKRIIDGQILSHELVRLKKSFGEKITPPPGLKTSYTVEYLEERIEQLTCQLGACPKESEREMLENIMATKVYPTRDMLNDLADQIVEIQSQIDEMALAQERFHAYQVISRMRQQYILLKKDVRNTKSALDSLTREKTAVDRLKQLQREAETMSMENVIDTINIYAAEYLEKFFDDTIRAELIQYKKTCKTVKLSIEMDIEYKGQKYDISEFSQGEVIKINLAFILAMNRLVGSKYLFL
ncbi:MAG: AAA family ATPase, partial [Candidatus Saccharibacteria bacterium]